MNTKTKKITTTAILLAICIAAQCFKGISVYITGPIVNATLILATLSAGLFGGLTIAICSPVVAYFMGATPIMSVIPLMILVIMLGNAIIVFGTYCFRKKLLPLGLLIGSGLKACFLWLTVWYVMLPNFGVNIPSKMQNVMKTTFSLTQLITALVGSVVAYLIWLKLKNVFKPIAKKTEE